MSTREICKSYHPSAPGYSSPTGLHHFHTQLLALLPLQVTLPLEKISWLEEIGVTESESSPTTPGLPSTSHIIPLKKSVIFFQILKHIWRNWFWSRGKTRLIKNLHPFLSWCSPTGQCTFCLMFPGKATMNSACCHLGWLQCQALLGGLCWHSCPLCVLQAFKPFSNPFF